MANRNTGVVQSEIPNNILVVENGKFMLFAKIRPGNVQIEEYVHRERDLEMTLETIYSDYDKKKICGYQIILPQISSVVEMYQANDALIQ